MIEREKKRIRLEKKYALKRTNLLNQYRNEKNFNQKLEIHSQIQKLPRNSAKTRIRNRCWETGRPRGVFRDFGVTVITEFPPFSVIYTELLIMLLILDCI